MNEKKREIIGAIASIIAMLLAAVITWDLVMPESWRMGIPECFDGGLGLTLGLWLGWALAGNWRK